MNNLTKEDLGILEELINEEIINYLDSGYSTRDEYVINLRNLLQKLNLKENYKFDNYAKGE